MVWYSHLFKKFPVCCDTHKHFGIVNKAEVDVFLELSCFFNEPRDVGNLILCLFYIHLEHLEVLGSCSIEA